MNVKQNFIGSLVLGAALAALSGQAMVANAATNVDCLGVNSCKGQSECKTSGNACKGQNECKGHGSLSMTAAACAASGGVFDHKK